jgi:hypothetical protein
MRRQQLPHPHGLDVESAFAALKVLVAAPTCAAGGSRGVPGASAASKGRAAAEMVEHRAGDPIRAGFIEV